MAGHSLHNDIQDLLYYNVYSIYHDQYFYQLFFSSDFNFE